MKRRNTPLGMRIAAIICAALLLGAMAAPLIVKMFE